MTSIGHIYMIMTPLDNSFCYIGSTFNRLHKRFETHKKAYIHNKDKLSIYKYFEKYGIENFKIIKIKSYNVIRLHKKDFKHLHAYETLWINKTKNCCNKLLPFNPIKKYTDNLQKRIYKKNNKDRIKIYNKEYKIKNKKKIDEYKSTKWYCYICHSSVRNDNKYLHLKTNKHKKNLSLISQT